MHFFNKLHYFTFSNIIILSHDRDPLDEIPESDVEDCVQVSFYPKNPQTHDLLNTWQAPCVWEVRGSIPVSVIVPFFNKYHIKVLL